MESTPGKETRNYTHTHKKKKKKVIYLFEDTNGKIYRRVKDDTGLRSYTNNLDVDVYKQQ